MTESCEQESFETLQRENASLKRWLRSAESKCTHLSMMVDQILKQQGYHEFVVFDDTDGHKSIRMKTPAEIQQERDELVKKLDRQTNPPL